MSSETQGKVQPRRKTDGEWYWVSKEVIRKCAAKVGFSATAVYHFLASMVDQGQRCYPSQQYLARNLGCSRSTVNRAVRTLEKEGLLVVERQMDHGLVYTLLEVSCSTGETNLSHGCNLGVQNVHTNKNHRTRINNNLVELSHSQKGEEGERRTFETKEEVLAYDLAEGLDDSAGYARYLKLAWRFPEPFLREKLAEARQFPTHKIRKSRAALFGFLVYHHGDKS